MAEKFNHIILIIADKVRDSITNRRLHTDYPLLLEYCRSKKVSSYALDLIIQRELKASEIEELPLPRQMLEKVYLHGASPSWGGTSPDISGGGGEGGEKGSDEQKSKKGRFSRILRKIGIIVWALLTFCLLAAAVIIKRDASATKKKYYDVKEEAMKVARAFKKITPPYYSDWTSSNHGSPSEDIKTMLLYVDNGDRLSARAWADCENTHDYLEVSIGEDGERPTTLCKLSGRDNTYDIDYQFKSGGVYYLYLRFRKDGSISSYSDRGGLRNIELTRNLDRSIEVINN